MYPTLISLGPIHISSFFVFILIAWAVFSFLFWRQLRNQAIREDYIYHLMFFGTVAACVGARLGFVLSHWELFSGPLWIRMFTLWIQPGLSLYGGFLAGGAVMMVMSRQFLIPRSLFLDAFTIGFSSAFPWGAIAALLDGTVVGTITPFGVGVTVSGYSGLRHPVLLYAMFAVFFILLVLFLVRHFRTSTLERSGMYALWFFLFFSISMFCLEFITDNRVQLAHLTYNQWICIAIFAEAAGALITWGGGKELVKKYIPIAYKSVRRLMGGWYGKFSRRVAR